jgi:hypothetical protein
MTRVQSPGGAGVFLLTTMTRSALDPLPIQPPIQLLPGVKWLDHESDYSSPFSAEVNNEWNFTSTPPDTFMAWCLSIGMTLPFFLFVIVTKFLWNYTAQLTNLQTYSMEQSPWEANSHSGSQEIPCLFCQIFLLIPKPYVTFCNMIFLMMRHC